MTFLTVHADRMASEGIFTLSVGPYAGGGGQSPRDTPGSATPGDVVGPYRGAGAAHVVGRIRRCMIQNGIMIMEHKRVRERRPWLTFVGGMEQKIVKRLRPHPKY